MEPSLVVCEEVEPSDDNIQVAETTSAACDYIVYCLVSTVNPRRTYVGVTNNWARRIRMHNGGLVGGARATRAHRPWKALIHVSGFTKRQALRLEWAWKHKRKGGVAGPAGRGRTLEALFQLPQWTSKSTPTHTIPHIHIQCMMTEEKYRSLLGNGGAKRTKCDAVMCGGVTATLC